MMNEEETIDYEEEEGMLRQFVEDVVKAKKSAKGELIAHHLILAVNAEELEKIRLICEASFMIEDEILRILGINKEEVETIYKITQSLRNTPRKGTFSIGWAFEFTEENYRKYIEPWHGKTGNPILFMKETFEQDLHPVTFYMLKNEFISWAMPKIMKVYRYLIDLVESSTYQKVLRAMMLEEEDNESN